MLGRVAGASCESFKFELQSNNSHVQVEGPHAGVIYEKKEVSEGQFAFTAKVAGEYKACFSVRGADTVVKRAKRLTDTLCLVPFIEHRLDVY